MPAKATPGVHAPANAETPPPKDLSHIRVGPDFKSTIDRPCGCGCTVSTKGQMSAIVENTRSGKKRAYLSSCLAERPELLARRETESEESFLG